MLKQVNNSAEAQKSPEPGLTGRVLKSLGRKSLKREVSLVTEPTPLPDGYRYKNPKLLRPKEVGRLFQQVEIGKGVPDRFLAERNAWAKVGGHRTCDVAVADAQGTLVGFGSIIYRGQDGTLSDFIVSPAHQGNGIGKAILLERLRVAEQMGITTLRVPKPEATNSLHNPSGGDSSFYLENGFLQAENGDLVRHTRH